eukprot:gene626-2058_t
MHNEKFEGVEWSVDGLVAHAKEKFKLDEAKPESSGGQGILRIPEPEQLDEEKAANFKRAGDEAFVKQDFPTAVEKYTGSLKHATRNHLVWANRAASYLKLEKYNEALSDARTSRALMPTYAKAWYREGAAYAGLQKWEDAACAHFEACNLEPKNEDLTAAFKAVIAEGQKAHKATQAK